MSRGRRRIRREQPAGRPSIFFMVALALGILIVLWFFVQTLRHPAKQPPPPPARTTETFHHRTHREHRDFSVSSVLSVVIIF